MDELIMTNNILLEGSNRVALLQAISYRVTKNGRTVVLHPSTSWHSSFHCIDLAPGCSWSVTGFSGQTVLQKNGKHRETFPGICRWESWIVLNPGGLDVGCFRLPIEQVAYGKNNTVRNTEFLLGGLG